jgi:hypothetical protein
MEFIEFIIKKLLSFRFLVFKLIHKLYCNFQQESFYSIS